MVGGVCNVPRMMSIRHQCRISWFEGLKGLEFMTDVRGQGLGTRRMYPAATRPCSLDRAKECLFGAEGSSR